MQKEEITELIEKENLNKEKAEVYIKKSLK